jgi:hypothetical protein
VFATIREMGERHHGGVATETVPTAGESLCTMETDEGDEEVARVYFDLNCDARERRRSGRSSGQDIKSHTPSSSVAEWERTEGSVVVSRSPTGYAECPILRVLCGAVGGGSTRRSGGAGHKLGGKAYLGFTLGSMLSRHGGWV